MPNFVPANLIAVATPKRKNPSKNVKATPVKSASRKAPATPIAKRKTAAPRPKAPVSKEVDRSTEEKIKEAARKLFTQKGFAATRTRDIAEEAGINLALLNYYFRNKQKLFDMIMWENMQLFLGVILQNLDARDMTLEEMLEFIANTYIDLLLKNPDLPFFVLGHIQAGSLEGPASKGFLDRMDSLRNTFFVRFEEEARKGNFKKVHPLHFMANLMGLIIFPFLASRLLTTRFGLSQEEFVQLMEERKEMIPGWLKGMFA